MKGSIARVAAVLLLAAAISQPPRAQQIGVNAAPGYTVQYLAGLGGTHSRGNSINNDGWIAGYSHLDDSYRHAAPGSVRRRSTSVPSAAKTSRRTATSRGRSRTRRA